jgi:hypothetical protein
MQLPAPNWPYVASTYNTVARGQIGALDRGRQWSAFPTFPIPRIFLPSFTFDFSSLSLSIVLTKMFSVFEIDPSRPIFVGAPQDLRLFCRND